MTPDRAERLEQQATQIEELVRERQEGLVVVRALQAAEDRLKGEREKALDVIERLTHTSDSQAMIDKASAFLREHGRLDG